MKNTDFIRKAVVKGKEYRFVDITLLEKKGIAKIGRLPFSIRILVENLLRKMDGRIVTEADVLNIAKWKRRYDAPREIPYHPARVLMQDFTGVPAVVDLAAMRDAVKAMGGDPRRINPLVPVDLIIDHSIQVDAWGTAGALTENVAREYERNGERYALLKWAQASFDNFRVVPPNSGICHQVNLEYIGRVITVETLDRQRWAYPDTVVGPDSHTTMINGLGVMGWGVGGIEAEAVMLGQPYYMVIPEVIGVRLNGRLREGVTATDLVLTVTQMLRKRGVVEKFVEYFGPGIKHLSVPDRATISNMTPEYGATLGFFPVDATTIDYLRMTNRYRPRRRGRGDLAAHGAFLHRRGTTDLHRGPAPRPGLHRALRGGPGPAAGPHRAPGPAGDLPQGPRLRGRTQARRHAPHHVPAGVRLHLVRARTLPAEKEGLRAGAERPGHDPLRRRCRHRRDHLLHEHLQPLGPDRRRARRAQGGRARTAGPAARENLARTGLARGRRLPEGRRGAALPGGAGLPPGRLRMHDLHRQQRPAAAGRSRRPLRATT